MTYYVYTPTDLPTYLVAHLATYPLVYISTELTTYLSSDLSTDLFLPKPTHLFILGLEMQPTYTHAYLATNRQARLLTYIYLQVGQPAM